MGWSAYRHPLVPKHRIGTNGLLPANNISDPYSKRNRYWLHPRPYRTGQQAFHFTPVCQYMKLLEIIFVTGTPRVKVCSSSKPDTLIPSETMARTQSVSAELSDRKTKRPAVYPSLSLSAYPLVCMLLSDDMPNKCCHRPSPDFRFRESPRYCTRKVACITTSLPCRPPSNSDFSYVPSSLLFYICWPEAIRPGC